MKNVKNKCLLHISKIVFLMLAFSTLSNNNVLKPKMTDNKFNRNTIYNNNQMKQSEKRRLDNNIKNNNNYEQIKHRVSKEFNSMITEQYKDNKNKKNSGSIENACLRLPKKIMDNYKKKHTNKTLENKKYAQGNKNSEKIPGKYEVENKKTTIKEKKLNKEDGKSDASYRNYRNYRNYLRSLENLLKRMRRANISIMVKNKESSLNEIEKNLADLYNFKIYNLDIHDFLKKNIEEELLNQKMKEIEKLKEERNQKTKPKENLKEERNQKTKPKKKLKEEKEINTTTANNKLNNKPKSRRINYFGGNGTFLSKLYGKPHYNT